MSVIKMTSLFEIRKVAVETLQSGKIVDQYKWNVFCTMLKTFPSSDDFSADDLFNIMTLCCDMCQKDEHHHEEHGSCCKQCAQERENAEDIVPFIMKNYYHAHNRHYDDATDIWFAHGGNAVVYEYEMINDCLPPENNFYELCESTCACCSCPISSCGSKFSYIV